MNIRKEIQIKNEPLQISKKDVINNRQDFEQDSGLEEIQEKSFYPNIYVKEPIEIKDEKDADIKGEYSENSQCIGKISKLDESEVQIRNQFKVTVYCNVCSLEFSSQVALDTHLGGSKHRRKFKSKELMKNFEETESGIEWNTVTDVIHCTICNVTMNSPHLLATHVAGNKHKSKKGNKVKRENEEEGGTPAKKLCSEWNSLKICEPQARLTGKTGDSSAAAGSDGATTTNSSGKTTPPKKLRAPPHIQFPDCVSKLEDTEAGGKFLCNPCQAHCSCYSTLLQHLASKKHVSWKKGLPPPSDTTTSGRSLGYKGGLFDKGRGILPTQKWDSLTSSSTLLSSSLANSYSTQSTFPDSSLANIYTNSYGLPSLGHSASTDYSFNRSSNTSAIGSGLRGSVSTTYGMSDPYSCAEGIYGRTVSAYPRTEFYPRADYATEYQAPQVVDLSSYSRAATGYGADYSHGYATSYAPRMVILVYNQPTSDYFVPGGSIIL